MDVARKVWMIPNGLGDITASNYNFNVQYSYFMSKGHKVELGYSITNPLNGNVHRVRYANIIDTATNSQRLQDSITTASAFIKAFSNHPVWQKELKYYTGLTVAQWVDRALDNVVFVPPGAGFYNIAGESSKPIPGADKIKVNNTKFNVPTTWRVYMNLQINGIPIYTITNPNKDFAFIHAVPGKTLAQLLTEMASSKQSLTWGHKRNPHTIMNQFLGAVVLSFVGAAATAAAAPAAGAAAGTGTAASGTGAGVLSTSTGYYGAGAAINPFTAAGVGTTGAGTTAAVTAAKAIAPTAAKTVVPTAAKTVVPTVAKTAAVETAKTAAPSLLKTVTTAVKSAPALVQQAGQAVQALTPVYQAVTGGVAPTAQPSPAISPTAPVVATKKPLDVKSLILPAAAAVAAFFALK